VEPLPEPVYAEAGLLQIGQGPVEDGEGREEDADASSEQD